MEHNETYMKSYNNVIDANPVLNKEDEIALLKIVKNFKNSKQKQEARDKLIKSNLRMVLKEAARFNKTSTVSVEDLMSAGIEGLCVAIDRFRVCKKTKLSTYAIPWIRVKIGQLITNCTTGVYIPRHIIQQSHKYRTANNIENMTDKELMKELNVTERGLNNIRMAQGRVVSMNEAKYVDDSGNETTMQDLIADPIVVTADKLIEKKETKERLREELAKLDPISLDILLQRYITDEKQDLHEIGKAMHITGERVRQIECKALKLLRRRMKSRSYFGV